MLVDDVTIQVTAGKGGDGLVHFVRSKRSPKGGPDGGAGGKGGDVYFLAVSNLGRLSQFRYAKKFRAQDGQNGKIKVMSGIHGADLVLEIPVGTTVTVSGGDQFDFTKAGQKQLIAKGGAGGWGNHHFRGPSNTTPLQAQPGKLGQTFVLRLELKLIAQIGLIGLPNAGKSSLLNCLTKANVKVANYPFTTLEPNLGVLPGGQILADIPGIIAGASLGKGLGNKFLRHIEKTAILVHCISLESQDPLLDYQTIRTELLKYDSAFGQKPELIVLTKSDLVTKTRLTQVQKGIAVLDKPITSVTILDDASVKNLSLFLLRFAC